MANEEQSNRPVIKGKGPLDEGMLRQELQKAGIHTTDELVAQAKAHVDALASANWYVLFGSNFVLVVNDF